MTLVEAWLNGIGLSYASFEAAGIVTPEALAELDVTHFQALGVSDPAQRRKLFYLVQRIKMAVDPKQSAGAIKDQEEVDAVLSVTLSSRLDIQNKAPPLNELPPAAADVPKSPSKHRRVKSSYDGGRENKQPMTTRSKSSSRAKSRTSGIFAPIRKSAKPELDDEDFEASNEVEDDNDDDSVWVAQPLPVAVDEDDGETDRTGEESSVLADDEASRRAGRRFSRRLQQKRLQNESDTTLTADSGRDEGKSSRTSRGFNRRSRHDPFGIRGTNGKTFSDFEADDEASVSSRTEKPASSSAPPPLKQSATVTGPSSLPAKTITAQQPAIPATTVSTNHQSSSSATTIGPPSTKPASTVSTPSTKKAEGSSTSRPRRFESKLQNPNSRTGKALSAIPSEAPAPMSPLMDLPVSRMEADVIGQTKNQTRKKGGTGVSKSKKNIGGSNSAGRLSFGGAGSGTDSDSGTRRRRRAHSTSGSDSEQSQRTRRRSGSQPKDGVSRFSSGGYSKAGSGRRSLGPRQRSSSSAKDTRPQLDQTDQKMSASSSSRSGSNAVFVHGTPEDTSWATQVEKLRQDNQADHDLFYGSTDEASDDEEMRIRVVVRKRPLSNKETGDIDVIHPLATPTYGKLLVYQPKTRVDLTREVETISFAFDNVFGESDNNRDIYNRSVKHLIPGVFAGKWASCFAYGQTGSGKTFTMMGSHITGINSGNAKHEEVNRGLYYMAAIDLFSLLSEPENRHLTVGVSLFEIYGGKLYDLLNKRKQIKCLEDARGKVCFPGLSEHPVSNPDGVMDVIEIGARNRSTGTTSKNADSSRSHAVLQLSLRKTVRQKRNVEHGRMTFIDLAGSERGADTDKANRATRLEGAEINTSLLALKEVIRALATGDSMAHIPFRGSKLTQVLKESFVGKKSRTVMVACIAPNMSNCEHTLNTLRYADRVKERNAETGALSASVAASSKASTRNVTTRATSTAAVAPSPSCSPDRSQGSSGKGEEEEDILDYEVDLEAEFAEDFTSNSDVDSKLLDSLLQEASSPSTVPTSRPESPRNGIGSKRAVADALISTHREVMTDLLLMMKTEMDLVKKADADRDTVDNYLDELETIHDQQVTLLGNLHDKLLDYQGFGESEGQESRQKDRLDLFSDDDSFDDLRG